MAETRDLLIEVGTEELPPKALGRLSRAFGDAVRQGVEKAGLEHGQVAVYATPRRLAVLVTSLADGQEERETERRGPTLAAAFDADGNPTRAAEGFARSCGVPVEHLEHLETDKGSWLVFRTTEVGQATASLVPGIVEVALAGLPIPKRMRWADGDAEFVRPVHWVVLLFGDETIEAHIMGVDAGRTTRGHRFHHPSPLAIDNPADYATLLYSTGYVMADMATRRAMIRSQVVEAAKERGGNAVITDDLLEEVTGLVEWPVAIAGSFDESFLELPARVLEDTLKAHQKCFSVRDDQGNLMPHFVTVSNISSTNPAAVRAGNERVIRPRLADAAFFFKTDLERPLAERLDELGAVVFQEKLGSLLDKSRRVSRLASHAAIAMGLKPDQVEFARRAGLLSKCDLLTDMVGELPELQGYMGSQYAQRSGEPETAAVALEEVYKPRFAGDGIPETPVGRAVALADKLDTLVGIFSIGQAPTGDKDPFALRRSALGVLRILIEGELDIEPQRLIAAAAEGYNGVSVPDTVAAQVMEFMTERLRAYFADQGISADVFAAVLARQPAKPFDFACRMRAVDAFRELPEAASLAAANKRIQNILKQVEGALPGEFDDTLFTEDAEWNLAAKVVGLGPRVRKLLSQGDYGMALTHLAGLRDTVDAFFDGVMVMADDEAVKRNRIALLHNISELFLATADISRLQPGTAE